MDGPLAQLPLLINAGPAFWAALALAGAAVVIAFLRRPPLPRLSYAAATAGLLLLVLASAGVAWNRASPQEVAVMVDLSPSTRTADYRDRLTLERRIRELLRDTPYHLKFFASQVQEVEGNPKRFSDLPADHTTYTPPAGAAAVLLFSDCRFQLPAQSPPTYVVVDAGLADPEDAAVVGLELREKAASVTIRNSGGTRRLTVNGAERPQPTTIPTGSLVVSQPIGASSGNVSAELSAGDAWPENDSLSAVLPPPEQYERWLVGRSNPGAGWRVMLPDDLPADPAAYLNAGVIVLENVAAADLGGLQQQRLNQYVRDLGGGLLILGGDRAYAAGGYEGTALDSLSPLASDPPAPTYHWILLADSSGSMSSPAAGATRWKFVNDAISQLLPHLPPDDLASVGSFSESLQWWAEGKSVRDATALPLPPANAYPHGPTNLQPALESIAKSADGKMPVQLLVLSDFDTQITQPDELATLLKSKDIHLSLLAIGEGNALPVLRGISKSTGGSIITEVDPTRWASSARQLARAARSKLVEKDPVQVTFSGDATATGPQSAATWNRVWLKDAATRLAATNRAGEPLPMAARWNLGEGRVIGVAFDLPESAVQQLATLVSRPPHDPRYRVKWDTGGTLHVAVDAVASGAYLNKQSLSLELAERAGAALATHPIEQTAPGRYELSLPAPRSPGVATVRAGAQVIGRVAIAGRYAPEFDAIGNDSSAMHELARRSGGAVVPPDQTTPPDIRWPREPVSLVSPLALLGAALIGLSLTWWRMQ
ncbi:MAG TPA: hypothetical protein VLJ39_15180 [Tepidisphaeraceae bacterium]|nr:hypothetical protein [Tepidisphaeraceae bacterium]